MNEKLITEEMFVPVLKKFDRNKIQIHYKMSYGVLI